MIQQSERQRTASTAKRTEQTADASVDSNTPTAEKPVNKNTAEVGNNTEAETQQQTDKLAAKIRNLMTEHNITLAQLSEACNTAQSNISRYRNARHYPGGEMLIKLAKALNTTVENLTE